MKKENVLIFGVTGVVFAAAVLGGVFYANTQRSSQTYDPGNAVENSSQAVEVQKVVFLAEDQGIWYLGDLNTGTIFTTQEPQGILYDENGKTLNVSEIQKGDFFQVEGDGIMLDSYPGQYPGISRLMRVPGGTEADTEPFEEELSELLPEKDPSEIPYLNLSYTQPDAKVSVMTTTGGYSWSYQDQNGKEQHIVADSAFILQWAELSDLNTANEEGKTDLELYFSEEPTGVTAERWPAEEKGKDFSGGYPEGEAVTVEQNGSWMIPGAEAGYIYQVDAEFANGTVSYGFEVKK